MEGLFTFVNAHAVIISGSILALAYFFIATEKINKVTVALLGGMLTIILGLLSQTKSTGAGEINPLYYVNFIDFNVIFLLVSMMIIVSITARSGVFNWFANGFLQYTKGRPIGILMALGLATGVMSSFLDNVTTVILVMPVSFAIADKLDISPVPLLLTEIFSSNIGGTATLIGDPPNIIIGSVAGLSFTDFIAELSGIILLILFVVLAMMAFIFRKQLKASPKKMAEIAKIEMGETLVKKGLAIRSLSVLALVVCGFLFHDTIKIDASIIAMVGASVLLIFEKPDCILRDVEWSTIFFFIGLFIIVGGLEASGGIKVMADFVLKATGGSREVTAFSVLWVSGIFSGIIDNIPYTATMAPLIGEIKNSIGEEAAFPLWWCLSLGACLGGNMTIIGAAANVIVAGNSAKAGYPISFGYFLKFGALVTFVSLLLSMAYVWLRFLA